mgnify:CR=1 FL=1|jgi:hypothetical protein
MSDDSRTQTLTDGLEQVQERYRRRSLESRLESVAEDLRDIKLQAELMEALFEADVKIDDDLVAEIMEARDHVRQNEYDALDRNIDELGQKTNSARNSVSQSLSKKRVSYEEQVGAMVRINEKTGAYDQESLEELNSLLSEWNWRESVSVEEVSDFERQLEECRSLGMEMRNVYEAARSEIIEPLADKGIEDTIESILQSGGVRLGDLPPEEREELSDSDLGDYLLISLG